MDIYISQPMEGREKAECDKELVNVSTALKKEYKNKKIGFFFRICTVLFQLA
mgnify:FL=1